MLKDRSSRAIIAVHDIDRAKSFYRDVLGLGVEQEEMDGVVVFRTGETYLVVYASEMAGSNRANAVVWDVGDEIDDIAADLRRKGVPFEHYEDMPGVALDGDAHVAGDMRMVWFKDPDGNILHLNNM